MKLDFWELEQVESTNAHLLGLVSQQGVPSRFQKTKKKAATDGTVVGTVRPPGQAHGRYIAQGEVYFGHKKKHCIACQAVGMPDGGVASISEPVPARQHDRYGFAQSTLPEEYENLWKNTDKYDVFTCLGTAPIATTAG